MNRKPFFELHRDLSLPVMLSCVDANGNAVPSIVGSNLIEPLDCTAVTNNSSQLAACGIHIVGSFLVVSTRIYEVLISAGVVPSAGPYEVNIDLEHPIRNVIPAVGFYPESGFFVDYDLTGVDKSELVARTISGRSILDEVSEVFLIPEARSHGVLYDDELGVIVSGVVRSRLSDVADGSFYFGTSAIFC